MGLFNKKTVKIHRRNKRSTNITQSQNTRIPCPKKNISSPITPKKKWSTFFIIVGSTVGFFILVASIAVFGYVNSSVNAINSVKENVASHSGEAITTPATLNESDDSTFLMPPKKTNFLVMGLDQTELLADVILVGCFDRDTTQIDIISIPRDTYVQLSDADIQFLQDNGRQPPTSGVMKMNAVHSYAGKELGAEFQLHVIEDMLGINIDYYAEINTDAFVQIVDAVGGVPMTIPEGGLYYSDPAQNLTIAIPEGPQMLTGEQAEGVVRYRSTYPRGDLQRIEVQQEFMKSFFKTITDMENLAENGVSIATTIIGNINTNFPVTDIPKYIKYADDLDPSKLFLCTLPGTPQTIDHVSYYIHDAVQTEVLVQNIFYSETKPVETPTPTSTPATAISTEKAITSTTSLNKKELKIQVLNGGITEGLANSTKEELEAAGFNVANVGDYSGSKVNETRIYARNEEIGEIFMPYFTSPKIVVDENSPSEYDVIIILGLDE